MKASWSKISTVAAGCVLMLAFVSGCVESYDPEPMNTDGGSGKDPEQSGKAQSDGSENETTPPPSPDVEPVEVCGEITADDVRTALGLPGDAKVDAEDTSPEAAEGIPAGFSCQYSWGDDRLTDQVRVSVIPETDQQDAEEAFAGAAGEDAEPYEDVGDVAGFAREGRFGPGTLGFVTVAETGRGMSSVTVLGHKSASEDDYAALAEKLLEALGS